MTDISDKTICKLLTFYKKLNAESTNEVMVGQDSITEPQPREILFAAIIVHIGSYLESKISQQLVNNCQENQEIPEHWRTVLYAESAINTRKFFTLSNWNLSKIEKTDLLTPNVVLHDAGFLKNFGLFFDCFMLHKSKLKPELDIISSINWFVIFIRLRNEFIHNNMNEYNIDEKSRAYVTNITVIDIEQKFTNVQRFVNDFSYYLNDYSRTMMKIREELKQQNNITWEKLNNHLQKKMNLDKNLKKECCEQLVRWNLHCKL